MKFDYKTAEDRLNFAKPEEEIKDKTTKEDILAGIATVLCVIVFVLYLFV